MAMRKNPAKFKGRDKMFYEALMAERAKVLGQFTVYKTEILDTSVNNSNERLGMSTHMADIGGDTFQNEVELGRMSEGSDVLEMIEEAMERLVTGEYGHCQDCGVMISDERLLAKPHAIRCIKCASEYEKNR